MKTRKISINASLDLIEIAGMKNLVKHMGFSDPTVRKSAAFLLTQLVGTAKGQQFFFADSDITPTKGVLTINKMPSKVIELL